MPFIERPPIRAPCADLSLMSLSPRQILPPRAVSRAKPIDFQREFPGSGFALKKAG
jgi:hypothetical protein